MYLTHQPSIIALKLNTVVLKLISQSKLTQARETLDCLQNIMAKSQFHHLWANALTLNNYGCLYMKENESSKALESIKKASAMLKYTIHKSDYCSVLLNLCAVYSSMSNHHTAMETAQEAIRVALENVSDDKTENDEAKQLITLLCVGYYNLAAELQYLGSNMASDCYVLAKLIHEFVVEMIGGMLDGRFYLMVKTAMEYGCSVETEADVRRKYMM